MILLGEISLAGRAVRRVLEDLGSTVRAWNGGLAMVGVIPVVGLDIRPVVFLLGVVGIAIGHHRRTC
jgi:hypothetical protein